MKNKKEKINEELLGKIIELAKRGIGGEKDNAIRIIKKICKKNNLNFKEVMSARDIKEYSIYCKKNESDLLACVIYKYAMLRYGDKIGQNYDRTKLFFTTTADRFIETKNAFDTLLIMFKKEKRLIQEAFKTAFRLKHDLYYKPTAEEWKKIEDKKEKPKDDKNNKVNKMAIGIVNGLDDVQIRKQLKEIN